jgi:extracellular factor (EF) 3-hydroxypalmitic acid methyl ester biosynthesis protein
LSVRDLESAGRTREKGAIMLDGYDQNRSPNACGAGDEAALSLDETDGTAPAGGPGLTAFLDGCHARLLEEDDLEPVLNALCDRLSDLQRRNGALWPAVVAACRAHAIHSSLLEDPFGARAFEQPRGYPGDAPLLDLIYRGDWRQSTNVPPTPLGARIFEAAMRRPESQAVRARKARLAHLIDEVCAQRAGARVLSVACGHLREAHESRAVAAGAFGRFVAMDHDPLTLQVVRRELEPRGITAVQGSVKRLLRGDFPESDFDLIYAAGLYDYLDEATARALTALLFAKLRAGGRLLVANFVPVGNGGAYREAFMNWPMVYREPLALAGVASSIPDAACSSRCLYSDETGEIAYLELERAFC